MVTILYGGELYQVIRDDPRELEARIMQHMQDGPFWLDAIEHGTEPDIPRGLLISPGVPLVVFR